MKIEYSKDEVTIRFARSISEQELKPFLDYLELMELLNQNQGTEEQAQALSEAVKQEWWTTHKHRFTA